jgi:DNA replication protein DnaC
METTNNTGLDPDKCPTGPGLQASATVSPTEFDFQALDAREQHHRYEERAKMIATRGSLYGECRFSNFSVESPAQREALAAVRDFGSRLMDHMAAGRNLIVFGPRGTGKDHLLTALMSQASLQHGFDHYDPSGYRRLYRDGDKARCTLRWVNGMELFSDLRATFRDDVATEHDWRDQLFKPSVLAISDPLPPCGALSEWQQQAILRVVDFRYSHRKPIWLTMNVADRPEMDARLGAMAADRLIDNAVLVGCCWASHRRKHEASA